MGRKTYKEHAGEVFGGDWDESKHPRNKQGEFTEANEFRYIEKHENKKIEGHPAHIYAKNEISAKYMQITHSEFIKDMKDANIKLKQNPNPKDKRTAYVIPKSEITNLDNLGKMKNGWRLSEIDDDTVMVYRDEPFNKKR